MIRERVALHRLDRAGLDQLGRDEGLAGDDVVGEDAGEEVLVGEDGVEVDRTGLLEAAVAAGSSAMPVKLPSPSAATAEHAGPVGIIADSPIASVIVSVIVSPVASSVGGNRT